MDVKSSINYTLKFMNFIYHITEKEEKSRMILKPNKKAKVLKKQVNKLDK